MDPMGPVVGGSDIAAAPAPSSKRSPLKGFLIGLAAVLVIGGASAAAYVGIILPNKPINVLKMSLANTLQQPQSTFKGSLESAPSAGGVAYRVDYSGASDSQAKAVDIKLNLTVSGVNFPIEGRLVNKNIYVKVGDLKTITSLIAAYSPDAAKLADSLNSELSNQWIVIDSTLLNESGLGCVLDSSWSFSKADINTLNKAYDKHAFVTIKSTGSGLVNGKKAEKLVLSIDNDKAAAFGNDKSLDSLSLAQTSKKCTKTQSVTGSDFKGNHGTTPLTVWVDKSTKRIVKIGYQSKQGSSETTINYNKVEIAAPTNAKPAVQVLTDIEKAASADPALVNLLGNSSSSSSLQ